MAQNVYKNLHAAATTYLTGDFNVVIKEAVATKNSKSNTMFKLKWAVEDGPHQGHMIYTNMNVSPDSPVAMRIFFSQLEMLGADESFFASLPDDLSQEQSDHLIAQKITGARALATVGVREWGGRKSEDITGLKPAGPMTGGVASPMASMGGVQATQLPTAQPAATPTSPSPMGTPTGPTAPLSSPPATPY